MDGGIGCRPVHFRHRGHDPARFTKARTSADLPIPASPVTSRCRTRLGGRNSTPEARGGWKRCFLSVYLLRGVGSHDQMRGREQTAAPSAGLALPCEPASVPRARERVPDWCDNARIRGDVIADIRLGVTEAATNAMRPSACVDFEVQGWLSDETLVVSVWDQRRGLSTPEPGAGLGTRLIGELADSVEFEHTQPGTRVTMRFSRHSI